MNKETFFAGKRFLITQPMIRSFCGSTMVTLELAEYLLSVGAKVTVYTNIALSPALEFYQSAKIKVLSSQDEYNWSLEDYDYVWIHSLTIPQQLLEELKHPSKKLPFFVFLHMSPLESIPDEHPWIFDLENSLSALSLYISEGTLESNVKYGLPSKTDFFRNPAPLKYIALAERKISKRLRRVLIVSNHPPEEVIGAKRILVDEGVHVDVYGEGQDKYEPISPSVLEKYDAVVTIGKTVQYCIVGSMPVYIYDWFGGPGWLNTSNYETTRRNNFSGRFSVKKTEDEIAREILDGYSEALDFHLGYLAKHKDEYLINKVMKRILYNMKPRKIEALESEYAESAKAAVSCAEIRFISSEELGRFYNLCNDLKRQVGDLNNKISDLNQQIDDYDQQIDEYKKRVNQLNDSKQQLDTIVGSKRFRILNKLLGPHDKMKELLKK